MVSSFRPGDEVVYYREDANGGITSHMCVDEHGMDADREIKVENGDLGVVTDIECADGTALHASVVRFADGYGYVADYLLRYRIPDLTDREAVEAWLG